MQRYSRRRVCSTGLLAGAGLLAGCLGSGEETTPGTIEPNPVVRDVGFDGGDLVVELPGDHDVSRVNLIDPGGELFTGASVARGETTCRLALLDIRPGLGGYEHYEPGTYRLVAIHGETETTLDVELQPDLRIVDVSQYRDGERNADFGKLAVTVENVGTGPTWVYVVTYRNAPNPSANNSLEADPGIPEISSPSSPLELYLLPGEGQTYVGNTSPMILDDDGSQVCEGKDTFSVLIASPKNEPIELDLNVSYRGEVVLSGGPGKYTCTDISVESSSQISTNGIRGREF